MDGFCSSAKATARSRVAPIDAMVDVGGGEAVKKSGEVRFARETRSAVRRGEEAMLGHR